MILPLKQYKHMKFKLYIFIWKFKLLEKKIKNHPLTSENKSKKARQFETISTREIIDIQTPNNSDIWHPKTLIYI